MQNSPWKNAGKKYNNMLIALREHNGVDSKVGEILF